MEVDSENKKIEYHADDFGMKLAAKAGYNPKAALDMTEFLLHLENGQSEYSIVSQHPHSGDRDRRLREKISNPDFFIEGRDRDLTPFDEKLKSNKYVSKFDFEKENQESNGYLRELQFSNDLKEAELFKEFKKLHQEKPEKLTKLLFEFHFKPNYRDSYELPRKIGQLSEPEFDIIISNILSTGRFPKDNVNQQEHLLLTSLKHSLDSGIKDEASVLSLLDEYQGFVNSNKGDLGVKQYPVKNMIPSILGTKDPLEVLNTIGKLENLSLEDKIEVLSNVSDFTALLVQSSSDEILQRFDSISKELDPLVANSFLDRYSFQHIMKENNDSKGKEQDSLSDWMESEIFTRFNIEAEFDKDPRVNFLQTKRDAKSDSSYYSTLNRYLQVSKINDLPTNQKIQKIKTLNGRVVIPFYVLYQNLVDDLKGGRHVDFDILKDHYKSFAREKDESLSHVLAALNYLSLRQEFPNDISNIDNFFDSNDGTIGTKGVAPVNFLVDTEPVFSKNDLESERLAALLDGVEHPAVLTSVVKRLIVDTELKDKGRFYDEFSEPALKILEPYMHLYQRDVYEKGAYSLPPDTASLSDYDEKSHSYLDIQYLRFQSLGPPGSKSRMLLSLNKDKKNILSLDELRGRFESYKRIFS